MFVIHFSSDLYEHIVSQVYLEYVPYIKFHLLVLLNVFFIIYVYIYNDINIYLYINTVNKCAQYIMYLI